VLLATLPERELGVECGLVVSRTQRDRAEAIRHRQSAHPAAAPGYLAEAESFGEQVPHAVKRERMARLVEAVQRNARERGQRFVGRTMEVLVEGESRTDPTRLRGRVRHGKTVNFEGTASAGELVQVEIEAATSTTLAGREVLASRLAGRAAATA